MRDVSFPVEVVDGMPIVIAPEEIDITNADGLRTALLRAATHGSAAVVVDMTRTTFCDSAAVHAMLGAHRRAQAEGSYVRFAVTGAAVQRILSLTAIDRLLHIYATVAEALVPARSAPMVTSGPGRLSRGRRDTPAA